MIPSGLGRKIHSVKWSAHENMSEEAEDKLIGHLRPFCGLLLVPMLVQSHLVMM